MQKRNSLDDHPRVFKVSRWDGSADLTLLKLMRFDLIFSGKIVTSIP